MFDLTWATGCVVLLALVVDCTLGEPPNGLHPVVWMGKLIRKLTPQSRRRPVLELSLGAGMAIFVPGVCVSLTLGLKYILNGNFWIQLAVDVLGLSCVLSLRGLVAAGERMRAGLQQGLPEAREALSWLCSRESDGLAEQELIAGTVESIAENASDSVIAPIFYYAVWGLPGAVAYRAINTMDAMVGYRGRYEYFGKAAARLDDLVNIVPARLTALLLLAGGLTTGPWSSVVAGWRCMLRDHGKTESPNAGWPMAAMAGMLNITLEKPDHYKLGQGAAAVGGEVIADASRAIVRGTVAGIVLLFAVIGAVSHGG